MQTIKTVRTKTKGRQNFRPSVNHVLQSAFQLPLRGLVDNKFTEAMLLIHDAYVTLVHATLIHLRSDDDDSDDDTAALLRELEIIKRERAEEQERKVLYRRGHVSHPIVPHTRICPGVVSLFDGFLYLRP
jgi:hypothetical protein